MKKIASPLFQDLSEAELDTLAAAGHLRTRQFAKHEVIFRAGSCVREIGIVLRGSVHIVNLGITVCADNLVLKNPKPRYINQLLSMAHHSIQTCRIIAVISEFAILEWLQQADLVRLQY